MKETEERPREKAVEAVLMAKSEEEVAAEIKKQMATLRAELTRIEKASQSFLQAQLS
jgi:hypothetical protein